MKDFKSEYIDLKKHGLTDREIADYMEIPYYVVTPLKAYYKIFDVKRFRKNNNGLTEEHFQKGLKIGLTRRLMNKRVRDMGFTPEQACSFPRNTKRGRKTNDQMVQRNG